MTSSDSSSQIPGNASGGDWQQETYQKIKTMNEMYFPGLNEMYQRLTAKLQQYDALPQQPNNNQLEKLRFLKLMLERLILFLRINKNDIQPNHREKLVGIEKQIVNILNSNRPRKPLQQGQLSQAHMHAMQQSQQQQPQISQVHLSDGQMNSQVQAMNAQGSTGTTQQNNLTNMQHNPSVSNNRQNMQQLILTSGPMQTQRVPEVPMNSSSQTGNASSGDWQEEIYQKIKSMNEMYSPELSEIYQEMAAKLQIYDVLPQQPNNNQLEKLRFLNRMLERLILFLRINKNDIHIQPNLREKVVGIEKQIVNILNSNRLRKQGQLSRAHMHAMQRSEQQQLSQVHSSDGQINSQVQAMNAQQNNLSNVQHDFSVSDLQHMMDLLQLDSNIDPALAQMQQVAISSLQQNPPFF